MNVRRIVAALLLWGAAAHAEDLSPEQVGKIQQQEQEALDKVNAAHGNKKAADMDRDERRQFMEEQRQASKDVLEKNGVSAKDYARAGSTLSRDDRERANASKAATKAESEKKANVKDATAKEPTIEYGIPKEEKGKSKGEAGDAPSSRKSGSKSSGGHRSKRSRSSDY